KLEDPRIVAIYEVGEANGISYIVMQWVPGESLEQRVTRLGRLPPQEALGIIRETAAALSSAHKAGIVHRDVKPGNILVDMKGAVKLGDFGIARPAGVAAAPGDSVSGSFHFMAPEQAYGAPPDPRSDLYSLGATWYYALTGQPPYPGSALDALMRHRDEQAPEVRQARPEVTERAAALLRRLMAKKVEDRPSDAQAVLKEMLSPGMLLETDVSGSPFKILPAPPQAEPPPSPARSIAAPVPEAVAKKSFALPPAPPAPAPMAALGSKTAFISILAVFGVAALGWQWRRAGPEDWPAGAALLALLPAALTYGDRRSVSRKLLSVAGCVAALACWLRHISSVGTGMPVLETAIVAVVGLFALFGTAFLGQWGQDRSEAVWSRVLGPVAGGCFLVSALAWSIPDEQAWTPGLAERLAVWWGAFFGSGGGWRWLGTAGLGAALGASVHLRIQSGAAPKDRTLNWNK
ncbi:MAG: hypothetical protein COV48_06360, partial [Elusimicrobia bacterium CG11_big_fil_rev_8_21_14_0_20_64_6]